MSTGWKIRYTDANGQNEQEASLDGLGLLEGGLVTGQGIGWSFRSHAASEVRVRIPGVDPKVVPRIAHRARVKILDAAGVKRFVGRRIDVEGQASGSGRDFSYQFQDVWWDLSKVTFKSTWTSTYIPVSSVNQVTSTVTLAQALTWFGLPGLVTANLYDANKSRLGAGFAVAPVGTPITAFTYSGGSGTAAGAKYVVFYYTITDAVLFQFLPNDPYQDDAHLIINFGTVTQIYINTGDQIREILRFAIDRGVDLQVGTIDCSRYVQWYPVRCPSCADAIKICLRTHPDCYTEIDYSTTPPTFNVRRRASLTARSLPYSFTDGGTTHVATNIKARPDLVPARVGIFYRVIQNGNVVSYPADIYPPGAADGVMAFDYSVDLQGPKTATQDQSVISQPFDPTALDFWRQKCPALAEFTDLAMVDPAQFPPAAGTTGLKVQDESGADVDWQGVYGFEFLDGATVLRTSNISVVQAVVTAHFKYTEKDKNGKVKRLVPAHKQVVRVRLTNTASTIQTFTQFLTAGEMIPPALAQGIYEALQETQYNLNHTIKQDPFVEFLKPGLHGVSLSGGNADWTTMNAPVQTAEYTLYGTADGKVFAVGGIKCGPVEDLEPGQLVQLYNVFANRDLQRIDPWQRITGLPSPGGATAAVSSTPRENTHTGTPDKTLEYYQGTTPDGSGNFTRVTLDTTASGIELAKYNASGTVQAGKGRMFLDLAQIASADLATVGDLQFRRFGVDDAGKPLYIIASGTGTLGGVPAIFAITGRQAQDIVMAQQVTGFSVNTNSGFVEASIFLTAVPVAKQFNMRKSISQENIDGTAYVITTPKSFDVDNMRSTADPVGTTQTEFAWPRYKTMAEVRTDNIYDPAHGLPIYAQCFIVAVQPSVGTGVVIKVAPSTKYDTPVLWQEISPGRVWVAP